MSIIVPTVFVDFFLTGYSSASNSKMAVPEWVYVPHMAAHGSSQQHQCRQRQALPVLVGQPAPL